ncbi:MAG: TRAP transporter substrate-binding protein DctP [Alphaproteobacteria bacterium]
MRTSASAAALALAALIGSGLGVGIGAGSGEAAESWTGYTYLASDSLPGSSNLIALAETFSEQTGGEIDLEINLAGSLGIKAADITQSVGSGIVQLAADGFFLGAIEEGGVLRLPMLFTTRAEFETGLEIMTPYLEEAFAEKNVVLLAQYLYPLQVAFGTYPIETIDDLKGHKLRVSSPEQGAFVAAFGGSPVTIGGAEVPTALQTGVVEGVFTASVGGGRLWKDQLASTYRLGPNFFNSAIIVNKDAYEALSPAHQTLLRELAVDYAAKATEENMTSEEATTEELAAGGMEVFEPADGEIDAAIETMTPYWDEWGESRSERTRQALGEVKKALGR